MNVFLHLTFKMGLALIMEILIAYTTQVDSQLVCIASPDIVFLEEAVTNAVAAIFVRHNLFVRHLVNQDTHHLIMHV